MEIKLITVQWVQLFGYTPTLPTRLVLNHFLSLVLTLVAEECPNSWNGTVAHTCAGVRLSCIQAQFYFHHPSRKKKKINKIKTKIRFYNLLLQLWGPHLSFIKAKAFSETSIPGAGWKVWSLEAEKWKMRGKETSDWSPADDFWSTQRC